MNAMLCILFCFSVFVLIFTNPVCILSRQHISFHVLDRCLWLVAPILDSSDLDARSLCMCILCL